MYIALLNSCFIHLLNIIENLIYDTYYKLWLVFRDKLRSGICPCSTVGQVREIETKIIIIKINTCNKEPDSILYVGLLTAFKTYRFLCLLLPTAKQADKKAPLFLPFLI